MLLATKLTEKIPCHDKNMQLKDSSLWLGEIKKHILKQRVILQIYETVLRNKCIVCMKLIMSQFLSSFEGRKRVFRYALLPRKSISHVR